MRLERLLILVPLSLLALFPETVRGGTASSSCGATVVPGTQVQAALRRERRGATICVSSGTYSVAVQLLPRTGQTIVGVGPTPPLLRCRALFCFDGSKGPASVTLSRLILEGARDADVRTGDGWRIAGVEARRAGVAGIEVRGDGTVIRDSYVHHNGEFGIRAVFATNLRVVGTEIAFNPTDPNASTGFSGGLKLNGVIGVEVLSSNVHDNGGGAGIWLDIDTQNFRLAANKSLDNAGDGIRVETSCNGTLESNTIQGTSTIGIDLFNSHDVTVSGNAVVMADGALYGIRMLSNGRSGSHGTGACMTNGAYENSGNVADSNDLRQTSVATRDGVVDNGGMTSGNRWESNVYQVPDCLATSWQWWDGVSEQTVSFAGWINLGADLTGSCTALPP